MTALEEFEIIQKALSILKGRLRKSSNLLNTPELVKNYLIIKLAQLEYEVFGILMLDINLRFIRDYRLFRGTLSHSTVYPREVIKEILKHNASNVIFYHNHPTGSVEPSSADVQLTNNFRTLLEPIDVKLQDHIIVSNTNVYCFSEHGRITHV